MSTAKKTSFTHLNKICVEFEEELATPSFADNYIRFYIAVSEDDLYANSPKNPIYWASAKVIKNKLILTLEDSEAQKVINSNKNYQVFYESYNEGFLKYASNNKDVPSFNQVISKDTTLICNDIFLATNILKAEQKLASPLLNNILQDKLYIVSSDKNLKLVIEANDINIGLSKNLSNATVSGSKITITGNMKEVNNTIANLYLEKTDDSIENINLRNKIAGSLKISVTDSKSSKNYALNLFSENVKSTIASFNNNQVTFINGVNVKKASFKNNTYTNSQVIDAEKYFPNSGANSNENLCWAGTASNMLTWTDYGKVISTSSKTEDTVFAEFSKNYVDEGGQIDNGLRWFCTGVNNSTDTTLKNQNSGNYLGYEPATLAATYAPTTHFWSDLANAVLAGEVLGLNITGQPYSHAVTCWGITVNTNYERNDPRWLAEIFITDSDDNGYDKNPPDNLLQVKLTYKNKQYLFSGGGYNNDYSWDGLYTELAKKDSVQEKIVSEELTGSTIDKTNLTVKKGQIASNILVNSGYGLSVAGQVLSASIKKGGNEYVIKGGQSVATSNAGVQRILAGATATKTSILAAGKQYLAGQAKDTTIAKGGGQIVSSGAVAQNTLIQKGATQQVLKGGIASKGTVAGKQLVSGLATAMTVTGSQVVLNSANLTKVVGGVQQVFGLASTTHISKGGLLKITSAGQALDFHVKNGGKALVESGGSGLGYVSNGGQLQVTSGASLSSAYVKAGGSLNLVKGSYLKALVVNGAKVTGVGQVGAVKIGSQTDLTKFSLSTGQINIVGQNNTISLLSLDNAKANFSYDLASQKANQSSPMLTLSQKNTQKSGNFSVKLTKNQGLGSYQLSKNIVQAKGTKYKLTLDGTQLGQVALNKDSLAKNGVTYSLTAKANQITLNLALKSGHFYKGSKKGESLTGTNDSDIFYPAAGNDTISGQNGRDVTVYDTNNWGRDVISQSSGTMTILFKDLQASDLKQKENGQNLVLSKKSDTAQSITLKNYDAKAYNLVYTDQMPAFETYLKKSAPTAKEIKLAGAEVWSKTLLAKT